MNLPIKEVQTSRGAFAHFVTTQRFVGQRIRTNFWHSTGGKCPVLDHIDGGIQTDRRGNVRNRKRDTTPILIRMAANCSSKFKPNLPDSAGRMCPWSCSPCSPTTAPQTPPLSRRSHLRPAKAKTIAWKRSETEDPSATMVMGRAEGAECSCPRHSSAFALRQFTGAKEY